MIRQIVAVDRAGGFAKLNADGILEIPWNLPGDKMYYRAHIQGKRLLMGRLSYDAARAKRAAYNYVLTSNADMPVVNGEVVASIEEALDKNKDQDLWVIGGEQVYAETITVADELYITRVEGDFTCDRFYPTIPANFSRIFISEPRQENDLTYRFEEYKKQS